MLKKVLSLFLIVLLALTLAACDGDSAPSNDVGGSASTTSADSSAQGGATGNETVSPEDTTPEDGNIDLPKVEF